MTCGICATKKLVRHSVDEYEMTNVFNMLDLLLANMIYTVTQT